MDSSARWSRYFTNGRHYRVTGDGNFRRRFAAGAGLTAGHSKCAQWRGENLLLKVRVQARASCNEILGVHDDQVRIRTTATPTEGDANRKVIRLLADYLCVPPSRIALIRGQKHRNKQFLVTGPVRIPPELIDVIQ